jgi:hypothetical protein
MFCEAVTFVGIFMIPTLILLSFIREWTKDLQKFLKFGILVLKSVILISSVGAAVFIKQWFPFVVSRVNERLSFVTQPRNLNWSLEFSLSFTTIVLSVALPLVMSLAVRRVILMHCKANF